MALAHGLWQRAGLRRVAAVLLLAAGGLLAARAGLVAPLEQALLDAAFRTVRLLQPPAAQPGPVLVGIDEAFLESTDEPLTLSHFHLARFLDAAVQGGARVVALDLALPEKSFDAIARVVQPDADYHRTLLAALLRTGAELPVVAAKVWDGERSRFRQPQVDYVAALSLVPRELQPLASALYCPDGDGRIRRYPAADCQPDGSSATLASESAAALGLRRDWRGWIDWQRGAPFAYLPLQQVLALHERGEVAALRELFEGRALLLGTVLDDTDLLELPVPMAAWRPGATRLPGVVAHAQALRNMMNGGFVQPVHAGWGALLVGGFALFAWPARLGRKLALFALAAVATAAAALLLLQQGHWIAPGAALATGLVACAVAVAVESVRSFRERRHLTRTFSGYVSPEVLKEIVAGGPAASLQGRKTHVCVLFSDIRNFTTMSERLPPEEVVSLLNRYFERMTQAVHRHHGTVDKFIGDGLMAFFGAPNPLATPEAHAFAAARDMLAALDELNRAWQAEGRAPVAIGIGLHSGEAVIGHIGSAERHAYTAIGDTVNTAARLEGLCKDVGYPVVCSGTVAGPTAGGSHAWTALGPQPLKGRSPVAVFGWRPDAARPPDVGVQPPQAVAQ